MAKGKSEGNIGSLFFGMTLDTTDFKKKLKSAQKGVKSAGEKISSTFKSIAKGGLVVSGAIAAGSTGMLIFAKNTLEATNAQLLLADSIGSTQGEVAGLELATQKWGVETNMVIDKMREFGGLNEFKNLAEEVKNAGDEGQQLAKSIELFGNEGAKMLPLLQQGAQGFADMEAEARALGLALSPEQIAKSRVAWEEYESTLMSIKGLGKQIGTAFIEPLGLIASGAKAFIATFKDDMLGGVKLIADSMSKFIVGAFDLFATYGIPFINGFISFAGQIGEAFSTLFNWLSPATDTAVGGLGVLFKGVTDFLATFKQNIVIAIAKPIEMVINGLTKMLVGLNNTIQEFLVPLALGLSEIGVVSEAFATGLSDAFDDQSRNMQMLGKDLASPFVEAQENALEEMAQIFIDQDKKNTSQIEKFKGIFKSFQNKFDMAIEKGSVMAVEATKQMVKSISDKSAGLILSGSQEEQNIINQNQDKSLKIQTDSLKEQKRTNNLIAKLDTF